VHLQLFPFKNMRLRDKVPVYFYKIDMEALTEK